jgi:hypothetical protein
MALVKAVVHQGIGKRAIYAWATVGETVLNQIYRLYSRGPQKSLA